MTRSRLLLLAVALSGGAYAVVAACSGGQKDDPGSEQRLLVLDGIEVRLADVAPYVAFLDAFLPEGGRKVKVQRVLEDHLLPLLVSRRVAPEQRHKLFEEAQQLCSVATNAYELDKQSEFKVERKRINQTRLKPRLPVSMFLFDPLKVGSVSPPIEVPQGWIVATAFDLHQSPLATDDYVEDLQVGFFTQNDREWLDWWEAQKKVLADKCTFVHPDYREAMPPWIHLPKRP